MIDKCRRIGYHESMKTTLVIPDLHLQWEKAEKIIKAVGPDQTVFLGDYFDSFDETPQMVDEMTCWLTQSVKNPKRIHLVGNHDLHYMYENHYFRCSGYEQWKYFHINDIVKRKTWDKLKHYHILDNTWLLTHAGFHKEYIPLNIQCLALENRTGMFKAISEYLDQEIRKGMRGESWIFHAGQIRGGHQRYGGINWCDSREFIPIKGLNQIFGHTHLDYIRWINVFEKQKEMCVDFKWTPNSKNLNNPEHTYNLCLDTGLSHYAVWDGSNLKIHWIGDL